MLPLIVVEQVDVDVVAVPLVVDDEALEAATLDSGGEAGSDIGDDGGDCFMSNSNGDLHGFAFGAPFSAELLANCK